MQADFHNSHIVTTRCKDHHFPSTSRNLRKGNESFVFDALRDLGVSVVFFKCVIQNKLRVVSEQLLFLGPAAGPAEAEPWVTF